MADQGGKYGDLIKRARQQEENQQTSKPDERMVNLCAKVPESWRRHWAAEAKRKGITMTEVMIEALTQQFGLPDDQRTR
jgi:hypothetical protein